MVTQGLGEITRQGGRMLKYSGLWPADVGLMILLLAFNWEMTDVRRERYNAKAPPKNSTINRNTKNMCAQEWTGYRTTVMGNRGDAQRLVMCPAGNMSNSCSTRIYIWEMMQCPQPDLSAGQWTESSRRIVMSTNPRCLSHRTLPLAPFCRNRIKNM